MLDEWKAFGRCGLKFATIAKLKCVHVSTISRYHKEHPELLLAYDEGLSTCENTLKAKAIELAESGDMDAVKYVLKHIADWKDEAHMKGEGFSSVFQIITPAQKDAKNRLNQEIV